MSEYRNLQVPSEVKNETGISVILDIADQLPVNSHYDWATLAGMRDINDLTTIVVHHDAWPKKNRAGVDDVAFAAEIAQDHIDLKANEPDGDAGFPYEMWIRNGRIYQCNDLLPRKYCVAGKNGFTVNICVSGDYYSYDTLTDPDRNALYAAILTLKRILPNYQAIKGHCELNPKNCPGFDVNRVRSDIEALEVRIKAATDPGQIKARVYKATEQHKYLYGEYIKDPASMKWLEPYLLRMDEVTQEMGMYFGK